MLATITATAAARADRTKNLHQPEAEQNDGGHAGKQILSRKLDVVDDGKRNQNPEKQEETGIFAPS